VHSGVLYIFQLQWGPANVAGPGVAYPLPHPLDGRTWHVMQPLEVTLYPVYTVSVSVSVRILCKLLWRISRRATIIEQTSSWFVQLTYGQLEEPAWSCKRGFIWWIFMRKVLLHVSMAQCKQNTTLSLCCACASYRKSYDWRFRLLRNKFNVFRHHRYYDYQ